MIQVRLSSPGVASHRLGCRVNDEADLGRVGVWDESAVRRRRAPAVRRLASRRLTLHRRPSALRSSDRRRSRYVQSRDRRRRAHLGPWVCSLIGNGFPWNDPVPRASTAAHDCVTASVNRPDAGPRPRSPGTSGDRQCAARTCGLGRDRCFDVPVATRVKERASDGLPAPPAPTHLRLALVARARIAGIWRSLDRRRRERSG